ncbi:hypothetical protein H0H93_014734 [Arthromyces matolae]|nr:hypothetical protein H0H93_014734 [Arthromyces matolae]
MFVPLLSSPTPSPVKGSGLSIHVPTSRPNSRNPSPSPKTPSSSPPPSPKSADLDIEDEDEASFEYLDSSDSEETLVQPSEHGSYAIMSPVGRYLDYDPKYQSYLIHFKFGDASTDRRWTGYTTHNPSFVYAHRKESLKGMGKEMEKKLLLPSYEKAYAEEQENEDHKHSVQPMLSAGSRRRTEWYEIYLGANPYEARKCKHNFWALLDRYGQDGTMGPRNLVTNGKYGGLDKAGYIQAFKNILKRCSKKPQEDTTFQAFIGSESASDYHLGDPKARFDIIRPHPESIRQSTRLVMAEQEQSPQKEQK